MDLTWCTFTAMTIINLTPHDVIVWLDDNPMGEKVCFPASGEVARLSAIELGERHDEGVLVQDVEFGHLLKSPPRVEGTRYIVSLPVELAQPRDDFLVPFREVRDDLGRIVGCRALARPV